MQFALFCRSLTSIIVSLQGGGPHLNLDFNNQNTGNMQVGRGSPWPPGSRENTAGIQSSVQSSIGAGQPIGNQPPRPPPVSHIFD